ncbi:MAG: viroplasmin family protein [Wujia sp.]
MAPKFYAVKVGLTPGIYKSWEECKAMVHGYPGAIYKSFPTEQEAKAFMGDITDSAERKLTESNPTESKSEGYMPVTDRPYAFVDGSYNSGTRVYGYGGFLVANDKKYIVTGSGSDEEMAGMRNVAGEVLGSMAAVKLAIELGLESLDIYYDYMGIEMWATGAWKRNKSGTIAYYEYMQSVKNIIKVNFIKVKGHSGVEGNEQADMLAKKAVNLIE